jgi:hypothetical protein
VRPSRRLDPGGPVDLDRRTWLKLRRGLYPLDARLDLHGLTQPEAHGRALKKNIYGGLGFYVYSLNMPVGLIASSTFLLAQPKIV